MFRRGLFFRILAAFLILVGMVVTGGMLYQAGQAHGYAAGLAASGAESDSIQPAFPQPYYHPGHFYRPHFAFFPFGGMFGLVCWGFLLFGLFGFIFHRRHWHYDGPGKHGYPTHWMKDRPAEPDQTKSSEPSAEPKP